ncbi:hypothetical protein QE152_g6137 [Popillia japonica]|uniref:Uncharacterized protein n=1 Tax=Popillia japonica TaxID=7064 RepID=A0AAW1ML55_POPJA
MDAGKITYKLNYSDEWKQYTKRPNLSADEYRANSFIKLIYEYGGQRDKGKSLKSEKEVAVTINDDGGNGK